MAQVFVAAGLGMFVAGVFCWFGEILSSDDLI